MIILAIDPGPEKCGIVVYDTLARRVIDSSKEAAVSSMLTPTAMLAVAPDLVAIERPQFSGQRNASADLLRTAEVCGRLAQRAEDCGLNVLLLTRREVCTSLHVSGAGKDSQVRERMIEMHGGYKAAAVGTKKDRGPLYGVASHSWQALGLAVVASSVKA